MSLASLEAVVTPDVRLAPLTVADADNGAVVLNRAITGFGKFRSRETFVDDTKIANPDDAKRSLALMEKEGAVLDLAKSATLRKVWLMPRQSPEAHGAPPFTVKSIAKALVARGRAKILTGSGMSGVQDLLAARNIGLDILNARGTMNDALMAIACMAMADRAIERLCSEPYATQPEIQALFDGIPEIGDIDEGMRETFRAELDGFVTNLATLRDPFQTFALDLGITHPEEILEIAATHPDPFNRLDSAKQATKGFSIAIANLGRAWSAQKDNRALVDELMKGWPVEAIDRGSGFSKSELADFRKALSDQPNPVGRLIIAVMLPLLPQLTDTSFRWRTQQEALRTVLALKIWSSRNGGKLPADLNALVASGILTRIPQDPYANGPFHYDPKRAVVWSVWHDGIDQGGLDPPGRTGAVNDRVWAVGAR